MCLKKPSRNGAVAQVIESLTGKHKALSSNLSIAGIKKERRKERNEFLYNFT
jgi:hypothetical protein